MDQSYRSGFFLRLHRVLRGGELSTHSHLVDPPPLRVEDLDDEAVHLERFADRRHPTEMRHQIAADGLEPFALDVDVQALNDLVDVHLAAEDPAAAPFVD